MKTSLLHLFILFIKIRYSQVNKGSPNNVKAIFIENTVGNGRIGNSYIPFPTKYRSEYVPNKEASKMAGGYDTCVIKRLSFWQLRRVQGFQAFHNIHPQSLH